MRQITFINAKSAAAGSTSETLVAYSITSRAGLILPLINPNSEENFSGLTTDEPPWPEKLNQ
jgi:hypothetical protein